MMNNATTDHDQPRERRTDGWRIAGAGTALAVAGLAVGAALLLRWRPCLAGYQASGCSDVQSHTYDYLLPSDPWIPIPGAAQLEGVAFLLVAVGLALGVRRRPRSLPGQALWWGLLGAVALIGALTLASGLLATTLPPNATVLGAWGFVGPLAFAAAIVYVVTAGGGVQCLRLDRSDKTFAVALAVLAATTPLPEWITFMAIYPSYDTPPWTGAIRAVLLTGLGIAAIATAFRPGMKPGAAPGIRSEPPPHSAR